MRHLDLEVVATRRSGQSSVRQRPIVEEGSSITAAVARTRVFGKRFWEITASWR